MAAVDETLQDGELLRVAADHATVRVPRAAPHDHAGDLRAGLAGLLVECADDIAVLKGDQLVGLLPIERLLAAPADTPVEAIMDPDPPTVPPGEAQERAAWEMVRRGESSLAVVGEDGRFVGLIPPHRMLAVLLAEHDEDLARIGGYLASTAGARIAAEEPVGRRLWHRLPWLLIGLIGAMLSAVIVGSFEEQLAQNVLLAFFVPAVVYMADAVGTQTEAVLIRGLSVGIHIRQVIRREILTGLIVGLLVGGAFVPFCLLGWGEADLAVAVGLALVASCSVATVVAMTLPMLFHRLGHDPAFGSGPLATVIQDLLSIVVYFAVAVPIAT
ncbi:MAG: magnesium transporter [Baekduiaceae bacterium]